MDPANLPSSHMRLKTSCLMTLSCIESLQKDLSLELLDETCRQFQRYQELIKTSSDIVVSQDFGLNVLPINIVMVSKSFSSNDKDSMGISSKIRSLILKTKDLAIQTLQHIIQKTRREISVEDEQVFAKIILNLSLCISKLEGSTNNREWHISETSHLIAVQCLRAALVKGIIRNTKGSGACLGDGLELREEATPAWKSIGNQLAKINLLPMTVECLLSAAKRGVSITDGPRELATTAIEALLALGVMIDSREVWSAFFPGVFSGLYCVAKCPSQGPVAAALRGLARFIVKVCGDSSLDRGELHQSMESHIAELLRKHGATSASDGSGGKAKEKLDKHAAPIIPMEGKAEEDQVAQRLKLMMPPLLTRCARSSNWKVRAELVNLAAALSLHCSHRFKIFLPQLLEVIVGQTLDSMPQVADHAQLALQKIRNHYGPLRWTEVLEHLTGRVWEVFASLPSFARGTDPLRLQTAFDLASGYLQVLGCDAAAQLESNMERLAIIFQQVFEFDAVMIQQVYEPSKLEVPKDFKCGKINEIMSSSGFSYYKKPFKHIRQAEVHNSARRLLEKLGSSIDILLFYDYCLTKLTNGFPGICCARNRQIMWIKSILPLLYVADGMISGHSNGPMNPKNNRKVAQLAEVVIPAFLDSKAWLVPTTIGDVAGSPLIQDRMQDPRLSQPQKALISKYSTSSNLSDAHSSRSSGEAPGVSAEVLHGYAQVISLLLETIGHFAECLGVEMKRHVMQVLYPILERVADAHPAVRHTALQTLVRIAISTRQPSLKELLHHNLDYLTDALCGRLRLASFSSAALPARLPGAIEALFEHSGAAAATPLLEDVVREVLVQVDLNWQNQQHSYALMRVLNVLVQQSTLETSNDVSRNNNAKHQSGKADQKTSDKDFWLNKLDGLVKNIGAENIHPLEFTDDGENSPGLSHSAEEVEEFFTNLAKKSKKQADEAMLEAKKKEDEEEREIRDPPREVKIVTEVLERCSFFIATKDLKLQTLVLNVLGVGLRQLRSKPRLLLPRVHKLWKPIVARLDDFTLLSFRRRHTPHSGKQPSPKNFGRRKELVLLDRPMLQSKLLLPASKADPPPKALLIGVFDLIGDIADLVGDFLTLKFKEDVWPHMKLLFKHWAEEKRKSSTISRDDLEVIGKRSIETSVDGSSSTTDFHSMSRKAQAAALRLLLRLCRNPECQQFIRPRVQDIANTCLFYLEKDMEANLRSDGLTLFCLLADINGDAIWLSMVQLAGVRSNPPIPGLERIKFKPNPRFANSASIIVKHLCKAGIGF